MTCPHCGGRYAWNTCPAGPDQHVRAPDEDTPDGQPEEWPLTLGEVDEAQQREVRDGCS